MSPIHSVSHNHKLELTHWETSSQIHKKTKGFVAEFRTITMLPINSVSCNHKLKMHWQTAFGTHEKRKGFVAEFRTIALSSLQNLLKLLKKISVVMMNHTFFSTFVHAQKHDESIPPEQRKTHARTWFLDSGRV
jgi:hypothetical protein